MSTVELKNKLKKKIEEVNEDYLLEHLLVIIEAETSPDKFIVPESHKKSIEIGLAQIEARKIFTNEEVMQRVQKWAEK